VREREFLVDSSAAYTAISPDVAALFDLALSPQRQLRIVLAQGALLSVPPSLIAGVVYRPGAAKTGGSTGHDVSSCSEARRHYWDERAETIPGDTGERMSTLLLRAV
jgi:hypothetical protein